MKATYIVHGFVQGVGYRAYVKGLAEKLKIGGMAMNQDDGSVLVIVQGEESVIKNFEQGLNLSIKYGIQVHSIEKQYEADDENAAEIDFGSFSIVKD